MNCADFERWLDEAMPAKDAGAAKSHAVLCPACARAWEAQRSLDLLLGEGPAPAPPLFTERIMKRVAAERRYRGAPGADPEVAELPWWTRVFAEPSTVLAFVVASFLIGWGGKLWSVGKAVASALMGAGAPAWISSITRELLEFRSSASITLGLMGLAALAIVCVGLYRGVLRMIST